MPNTNAFYKVVLNGAFQGQDIKNILWYRLGFDLLPGDFNLAGADTLADLVYNQVWKQTAPIVGYALQTYANTLYTLESVDVYPHDADFNPVLQLPYTKTVNEAGLDVGETNGGSPCAIVKMNLAPTSLLQGLNPPKRGYIAWGPIKDNNVGNDGRLTSGAMSGLATVAQKVSSTLTSILPPATFHPIRVKVTRVLGVLTFQGYADVTGATIRPIGAFRRSRLPEN